MTRVLIVDDSRTSRIALRRILEEDARMTVVGEAATAAEALSLASAVHPDVVTMDVLLGDEIDGVELTRTMLASIRTRVVVVSSATSKDAALSFRALAAGAIDVLAKPSGEKTAVAERERARFVRAIVALASVRLVGGHAMSTPPTASASTPIVTAGSEERSIRRVLIGASTGGPPLLASLLSRVPAPLSVPVVVVQHITAGFGSNFTRWLGAVSGHRLVYTDRATRIEEGGVYVAGDDAHLRFVSETNLGYGVGSKTRLSTPSVDELFESAVSFDPGRTLAILLTGMGSDGADGMRALRARGASTIAQTPGSCVVGSMPSSAIEAGGAELVSTPDAIVEVLRRLPRRPERALASIA